MWEGVCGDDFSGGIIGGEGDVYWIGVEGVLHGNGVWRGFFFLWGYKRGGSQPSLRC